MLLLIIALVSKGYTNLYSKYTSSFSKSFNPGDIIENSLQIIWGGT